MSRAACLCGDRCAGCDVVRSGRPTVETVAAFVLHYDPAQTQSEELWLQHQARQVRRLGSPAHGRPAFASTVPTVPVPTGFSRPRSSSQPPPRCVVCNGRRPSTRC